MLTILVVEDDGELRTSIAETLAEEGYDVSTSADGAAALTAASARTFDVVLTDVRLPNLDGLSLVRRLRDASPSTDTIVMTGDGNAAEAVAILKEGAFDYLIKPIQVDELVLQFARLGSYRELRRELCNVRAQLADGAPAIGRLVGHSPEMLRLVERIQAVAQSDASIVITGESGTGKELAARALHEQGPRRDKPFVAVNCAAFPDTLIEAELFGHERGAFTGAVVRREGRFKAAHGGTLFLDEVAELSPAAQAKLLRVLQEGIVEPLGSDHPVSVDVRLVSATNRDLKKQIAAGRFREDLFYRINTIDLAIPPLRGRSGDLPLLVNLFLRRFSPPGAPVPGITWRAWDVLAAHPFPGNVRELMHALEHAALLSHGGTIDVEHLPLSIRGSAPVPARAAAAHMAPLAVAMKEFERNYLRKVLTDFGGQRTRAAEWLGISRKNLWEKLRAHDLFPKGDGADGAKRDAGKTTGASAA
jgi:DNA-binding NtrC family response regulator